MQRVPINDAQNEFHFVMNQVCTGLGPVLITGLHGNAVLVCEAEWRKLCEKAKPAKSLVEADAPQETVVEPELSPPNEERVGTSGFSSGVDS
jgi:PHD/YefM family antitoxin component YafN of YafNO toxin-antitoxin module